MTPEQVFLNFSAQKLEQLSGRIADCLGKLSHDQVWARGSDAENAIGNLVLHLCGNLRQWIGTGVAGKPDIRVRDREFQARGDIEPDDLRERLVGAVSEAAATIRGLPVQRLLDPVEVQKYKLTVLEAIYHVVEHFAQHTGQVLFATKQMTGQDLGYYRHLDKGAAHGQTNP
jgi:uncharacterized damage-inducible protein DinB